MAKLKIEIPGELELTFTCSNYDNLWARASAFVGEANLHAKCHVSREGALLAFSATDENEVWQKLDFGTLVKGFFFDNTSYNVYAKIGGAYSNLRVRSRFASDEGNKSFASHDQKHVRSGDINFENDVGKFDFTLVYENIEGRTVDIVFTSEVLSQKLNSRSDWKTMIDDVEHRYKMLAADFLRRTYHSLERKPSPPGTTPDLVWWYLFAAEQDAFFKAVRTIIERPRKRLHGVEEYRRADQLRMLTPQLENEFNEHRNNVGHLYRVEYDSHSHDTPENRFVKFAVQTIGKKYRDLADFIRTPSAYGNRLSASALAEFAGVERKFKTLLSNPFFRGVGKFTGLKQMSLTLQAAPGYATVARTFAILKSSYMLFEGQRRLETKNIADLYEIWCFLKIEDILKNVCKKEFGDLFDGPEANHGELHGAFVKQLGTGSTSEVVFAIGKKEDKSRIELARIVYNPKITDKERKQNALHDTIVPTGLTGKKGQIPDIVLQLTRDSMNRDESFRLTYLFDAKYKIEDVEGVDSNQWMRPPQDAIDQMHRYRDAIYYAEKDQRKSINPADLKREVIGGYVLFPGHCDSPITPKEGDGGKRPKYFTSIDQVNIGAIPLRPNAAGEYEHLQDFIAKLLVQSPTLEAALATGNPQKGDVLTNASQESLSEQVVYGTWATGQFEWIVENNVYNLPVEQAEKQGVGNLIEAQQRKVLVLVPYRGVSGETRVFKVSDCKLVTKKELVEKYGYKDPSHDAYYLFSIKALHPQISGLLNKLKFVTLQKDGVCKGVNNAAVELGIPVVIAPDRKIGISQANGVVVFDDKSRLDVSLKDAIDQALSVRKSHQPLPVNITTRRGRNNFIRWLRILLSGVENGPYLLYIEGREGTSADDLSSKTLKFLVATLGG